MSETNENGKRQVDETLEEVVPAKRFVIPEISIKVKSWELPEDLATFLYERCQSYMPEKELEEFVTTPAPSNIKMATKLELFSTAKAQESAEKLLAKACKKKWQPGGNRPNLSGLSPSQPHPPIGGASGQQRGRGISWNNEVRMIPKYFPMSPAGDSHWGRESLVHAHPKLRDLFPKSLKKINPQHARLRFFLKNWKALTSGQTFREIVNGCKLPSQQWGSQNKSQCPKRKRI